MTTTTRRWTGLLTAAAAGAALIHGWDELLADGEAPPKAAQPAGERSEPAPRWFVNALREMRDTKSWGVVLLAPADAEGCRKLATAIEKVRTHATQREVLLEAVFVVVGPGVAGFGTGEDALLLDEYGRRVAGATVDLVKDPAKAAAALRKLLRDEGRLDKRADLCTDDTFKAALRGVASDDPAVVRPARDRIVERYREWRAAIFRARETAAAGEPRAALDALVSVVVDTHAPLRNIPFGESRVPFGAEWVEDRAPDAPDPCPACGMMVAGPEARRFLRLLAEKKD